MVIKHLLNGMILQVLIGAGLHLAKLRLFECTRCLSQQSAGRSRVQSLGDFTTWYLGAEIFVVPPPPPKKNLAPEICPQPLHWKIKAVFATKSLESCPIVQKPTPTPQKRVVFMFGDGQQALGENLLHPRKLIYIYIYRPQRWWFPNSVHLLLSMRQPLVSFGGCT